MAVSTTVFASQRPNIIVILADDLGYADVGFNGSKTETPNLDRLAEEGVHLESFYTCPVSSPTRAGVMTGRYPLRFGLMRSVIPPHRHFGISDQEVLLPQMLAEAGYEYRACFGKWHLGCAETEWLPQNRGFNHFIGCYNGAIDYFDQTRDGERDWHFNDETLVEEGYVSDLIGDHASKYIESIPKDEPYFIYVPFTAPHSPIQAKECDIAKYADQPNSTYAAMVDCMDQNIGKIIEAAKKRGDYENTFIIFFSDNGGTGRGSNGVTRGHKFDTYEGGIRVAAACQWIKGGITGGYKVNERMGYIDIFPTLKALAYGKKYKKIEDKNPLDGINILPLLRGEKPQEDRFWYTYIDQRTDMVEHIGVNYGDMKLVVARPAPDNNKTDASAASVVLYELNEDHSGEMTPAENQDIEALYEKAEAFMTNKSKNQIPRYQVKEGKFTAPKDWKID